MATANDAPRAASYEPWSTASKRTSYVANSREDRRDVDDREMRRETVDREMRREPVDRETRRDVDDREIRREAVDREMRRRRQSIANPEETAMQANSAFGKGLFGRY